VRFAVWAPQAQSLAVQCGKDALPMTQEANGWWSVETKEACPDGDYAFVVDGTQALPDPRSPWQPKSVHGPSRLIDHGAFPWTDVAFKAPPLPGGLVYEMHVGTFTAAGTFAGAIERLDHLGSLGVTHVQLMPVAAFDGEHGWGYDGVALYAPHAAYGTPDDLKRLIDECHARGLAVIADVVYNHL
jgi:maltooligosyltrehalose trehalohydrolase